MGRGDSTEVETRSVVLGYTADGLHAITWTSSTEKTTTDNGDLEKKHTTLVLVTLAPKRSERSLCDVTDSGTCPDQLEQVLKAGYPALKGLEILDPESYEAQPGDGIAKGYQAKVDRRGSTLFCSLVKGSSVIKLGSVPALARKLTYPPKVELYPAHRVAVFSLHETTEKGEEGTTTRLALRAVPFRVVLPGARRPAR
jgi:hypothetical protein